jgi:hypothetical protein
MDGFNGNSSKKIHKTKAECEAAEKGGDKQRVFEVCKGDAVIGFCWASNGNDAICTAARLDGYSASVADKKGEVTKDDVAAKLSQFTDEELEVMGLSRKKQKTPKTDKGEKQPDQKS